MKKLCLILLSILLLLTGCAAPESKSESRLHIACTTYPVYLLAQAVTEGAEGVELSLIIDQQISCLHNYTLSISDMKAVEAADLIVTNGAGLEDFLEDVLEGRQVLDCSEGIELLWNEEEGEEDPHLWLSPTAYCAMAQNFTEQLCAVDEGSAPLYRSNAQALETQLKELQQTQQQRLSGLKHRQLITFHDGFAYFAQSFGLEIVASVEEEEGSEASARRIMELVQLVDEYGLTTVYTEENGSDSAARALSQERGLRIATLNMGISRERFPPELTGLDGYKWLISSNIDTLLED